MDCIFEIYVKIYVDRSIKIFQKVDVLDFKIFQPINFRTLTLNLTLKFHSTNFLFFWEVYMGAFCYPKKFRQNRPGSYWEKSCQNIHDYDFEGHVDTYYDPLNLIVKTSWFFWKYIWIRCIIPKNFIKIGREVIEKNDHEKVKKKKKRLI